MNKNYEYILTSDGELYHWGWKKKKHKYIKRERKNGKWVYTYPDDVKDKDGIKSIFENLFGNKSSDTTPITKTTSVGKSILDRSYKNDSFAKAASKNSEVKEKAKSSNSLTSKIDKAKSWLSSKKKNLVNDIKNTSDRVADKVFDARDEAVKATSKANDKAKKWVNNLFESYQTKSKTAEHDYNTARDHADAMAKRSDSYWNLYTELKKSGKHTKKETDAIYKEALKAEKETQAAKRKADEAKEAYSSALDHPLRKLDDWLSKITGEEEDKKKVENNNEFLSRLKKKDSATSADDDMAVINPKYQDKDSRSMYDENCAVCTMSYDLRRRGYDVVAADELVTLADGRGGLTTDEITKVYKNCDRSNVVTADDLCKKYGKTKNIKTKLEYLEKDMLEHGEGTRANFMVKWSIGGGHSVAMEVENGKVVVRDCQTNEKYSLDFYADYIRDFEYLRTDNLELSEQILQYVRNREGGKKK